MKVSVLGVVAGIIGFVSLFLPWFSIELWTENLSSTMSFTATLFQLTGTVEGVTNSMLLLFWFNVTALISMTAAAATCIVGSLFFIRKRKTLLIVASALALIAMIIFAYGLANSSFASENLNPAYTISQFPEGSFRLSAEQSMQNSYNYSWSIGVGFWLALITAVLALSNAIFTKKKTSR